MTALLIADTKNPRGYKETDPVEAATVYEDMEHEPTGVSDSRTTTEFSPAAEGTEAPSARPMSISNEHKDTVITLEAFLGDDDDETDQERALRGSLSSDDADVGVNAAAPGVAVPLSRLKLSDTLGTGSSGSVFRAHSEEAGSDVALKVFQRAKRTAFQREESALKIVGDQPNIISLLGSMANADTSDFLAGDSGPRASEVGKQSVIALELCGRGDLFQLVERTGALPFSVARTYAHTLWRALATCHDRHVYHRDVKLENIFVADDWTCRLADFGFAFVGQPPKCGLTGTRGTKGYMSPEVFSGQPHDPGQADVWAMGVSTFILFMGHPPLYSADASCWFYRAILRKNWNRFWEAHERVGPKLNPMLKSFLQRCFTADFRQRPAVAQLLNDPWLAKAPLSPEALAGAMTGVVADLPGDVTR